MKSILCFFLLLLSSSVYCQIKVGVQAGYNLATFRGKNINTATGYVYHASSQPAFNAGIISSIPLTKRLSLQPSLLLSEKGAKEVTQNEFTPMFYTRLRIYYTHIPVQVMYTLINKTQWHITAGGGGFISKGIWGKSNTHYHDYSDTTGLLITTINNKVTFTNNVNNYNSNRRNVKPWDAGFTVAAAAAWKNWQLKASYDFGVVDIAENNHKSGVFSLSAGYYFWGKKEKPGDISQK